MYALLVLMSLLLIVVGSNVALGVLRRVESWRQRRLLQMLVLAAPAVSLGVGLIGLYHFMGCVCFLSTPPWDYTLSIGGPAVMGLVALGAVGLGVVRLALLSWIVPRRCVAADPALQELADQLAERMGASPPRVFLYGSDRPTALTWGLRGPTLLLSTWMASQLDARELESVLAHELGHVARHDCPVVWLATVLRDAFFYLPTSRMAYRQLQADKEMACDDLAVTVTQRPLVLASALAKVWHAALSGPALGIAQAFTEGGRCIEERIGRLVERTQREPADSLVSDSRGRTSRIGTSALVGLLTVQAVALIVILLDPIACSSASAFW